MLKNLTHTVLKKVNTLRVILYFSIAICHCLHNNDTGESLALL